MKGIILKDFYENYIIRKNLINWILGIIMLIVVVAVFRTWRYGKEDGYPL